MRDCILKELSGMSKAVTWFPPSARAQIQDVFDHRGTSEKY